MHVEFFSRNPINLYMQLSLYNYIRINIGANSTYCIMFILFIIALDIYFKCKIKFNNINFYYCLNKY